MERGRTQRGLRSSCLSMCVAFFCSGLARKYRARGSICYV